MSCDCGGDGIIAMVMNNNDVGQYHKFRTWLKNIFLITYFLMFLSHWKRGKYFSKQYFS